MNTMRKIGWMWQEDKESRLASLATRLNLAIEGFQERWGDVMPKSCFTSEELPDDIPELAVPVYYSMGVTPYHLWLEFPEGFKFKASPYWRGGKRED